MAKGIDPHAIRYGKTFEDFEPQEGDFDFLLYLDEETLMEMENGSE